MGKEIKEFSEEVINKLGFYVYALIDPREESYGVFYIGKGQGNRVFDHANGIRSQQKEEEGTEEDSEKIAIIKDILKSGKKVKYYILRDGLDEPTAFTVESTLIDLLTYDSFKGHTLGHLSNIQNGHHQNINGIKTVEQVIEHYGAPEVDLERYIHQGINFIAIKLNPDQIKVERDYYKRAHFCWKVSKERANNCHYVLAVTNGIIREVFPCLHAWRDTTQEEVAKSKFEQDIYRKCFDKEKADNKDSAQLQELRDKLIGKRIKGLHKAQNAIAYFDSLKLETTK